ncbi:uncharacterized protein LOC133839365 [Drosophila sulfurigaster albostrigata]|uniref:uncharacterized protein LOC133839365 n=1 Tax=Drosophila sulfurigaster albostrigata TaxID=89887 RepID=UPI002D21EDF2|nr:uncharacterized protein LOC133839365 [Drosophila sulfurigaster albostrigata]
MMRRLKCDLSPQLTTCLKLADSIRPDCCVVRNKIPYDAQCFMRDISRDLNKLYKRHEKTFVKSKRIMELAMPLHPKCRFVPKCACPFKKTIEIIPADLPSNTRTEQLALPTVRRLLYRREHAIKIGDKIGESILNRWLRSSYLSLYSRLGNMQPLKKPQKKKKSTPKEKKRQAAYIEKLSKAKVPLEPPSWSPLTPERKGEYSMRRLKKLARPKVFELVEKPSWELTPGMKAYKATDRIKTMAEPVSRPDVHTNDEPEKVSPTALKYKPSARIKEMATPLAKNEATLAGDLKEDPFSISPNALKYKPSSRIKELAEPKEFENTHIRENPFAISPAALKAKASPRLIELAKPKGSA